jgi:hypothetical protein
LAAVTSYTQFFSGTATVAGALVGLLFVALSVAPERLRGTHASVEHQAIASTAFSALVDALFISLIGLEPGGGLNYGAVILGGLGLTSSCGLAVRLWRSRAGEDLSRRWPYLLGFIIIVYSRRSSPARSADPEQPGQHERDVRLHLVRGRYRTVLGTARPAGRRPP